MSTVHIPSWRLKQLGATRLLWQETAFARASFSVMQHVLAAEARHHFGKMVVANVAARVTHLAVASAGPLLPGLAAGVAVFLYGLGADYVDQWQVGVTAAVRERRRELGPDVVPLSTWEFVKHAVRGDVAVRGARGLKRLLLMRTLQLVFIGGLFWVVAAAPLGLVATAAGMYALVMPERDVFIALGDWLARITGAHIYEAARVTLTPETSWIATLFQFVPGGAVATRGLETVLTHGYIGFYALSGVALYFLANFLTGGRVRRGLVWFRDKVMWLALGMLVGAGLVQSGIGQALMWAYQLVFGQLLARPLLPEERASALAARAPATTLVSAAPETRRQRAHAEAMRLWQRGGTVSMEAIDRAATTLSEALVRALLELDRDARWWLILPSGEST